MNTENGSACLMQAAKYPDKSGSTERQLVASPVMNFFLNRPFRCQKHHFKPQKRTYF
jgi:hypothetical protein